MKVGLVGNTHLIEGTAETLQRLEEFLKKEGIEISGNSDAYVRVYRSFGIDEARELRERAALRPAEGKHRIFMIATPSMTQEAQNALLKTLEEPPADALFFFIVASAQTLLPTLRSRFQILSLDADKKHIDPLDVKAFLAASTAKRLDLLKPLLEKGDDDKRDMGAILSLLSSLEKEVAKTKQPDPRGLHAIYRARKYITDKGALVKPLLEQVALLAPKA
jgi:DNA polymerase III gamma/tau subunit